MVDVTHEKNALYGEKSLRPPPLPPIRETTKWVLPHFICSTYEILYDRHLPNRNPGYAPAATDLESFFKKSQGLFVNWFDFSHMFYCNLLIRNINQSYFKYRPTHCACLKPNLAYYICVDRLRDPREWPHTKNIIPSSVHSSNVISPTCLVRIFINNAHTNTKKVH